MITRINMGPVHPGVPGALRLAVDVDGDTVVGVEPHIGFLHRGVEKLVEMRGYMQSLPYMEKLDYAAPMAYGDSYISAVESAVGTLVSERAAYARTILLELQRIASHLFWLGTMADCLGQSASLSMWTLRDREAILRLLEEASGARMSYVNMRLGGLARELPPGFSERAGAALGRIMKNAREYDSFVTRSPVFMERLRGIGVLTRDAAMDLGVTGPVLRGSGSDYDVRKEAPYYAYEKLGFRPQTRSEGDCLARYRVRMLELRESARLVKEAFVKMPDGSAVGAPIRPVIPRAVRDVVQVSRETPRGECMLYMVAAAGGPYRLSIRSPSFANLAALREISKGCRTADLFAIVGSLDLVMGEVDR